MKVYVMVDHGNRLVSMKAHKTEGGASKELWPRTNLALVELEVEQ